MSEEVFGLPIAVLDRWAAGRALPSDEAIIQRWLAESPDNAALLRSLLEAAGGSDPHDDWDEGARWHRLAKEHGLERLSPAHARAHRRSPRVAVARAQSPRQWLGVTANGVLVLGALGVALLWGSSHRNRAQSPQAPRAHTVVARNGEQTTIRLADGSQVRVLPGSTLQVPDDYGRGPRAVGLDGAALFTVVHDARHPFVVTTAHAVTRDLGTRFAVRAYRESPKTEVVVERGAVSVERRDTLGSAPSVLHARDRAEIGAHGPPVIQRRVDLEAALDWTQGNLTFDRTPLRLLVLALEREYGVTVHMPAQALEERRISVVLPHMALDELTSALSVALGMNASRVGMVITFTERGRS